MGEIEARDPEELSCKRNWSEVEQRRHILPANCGDLVGVGRKKKEEWRSASQDKVVGVASGPPAPACDAPRRGCGMSVLEGAVAEGGLAPVKQADCSVSLATLGYVAMLHIFVKPLLSSFSPKSNQKLEKLQT